MEIYKKSKRLLNEYIDLKKIVDRLQDVDKLKKILLNDSQKIFFDLIPEISLSDSIVRKSTINDKTITKTKLRGSNNHIILESYKNMVGSRMEINDKILSLLDEATLLRMGITKNGL